MGLTLCVGVRYMTAPSTLPTDAIKKTPHSMRVKMCAQVKADFQTWCSTKGFGIGGMTRALTTAIRRRDELRIYGEFSFPQREEETTLAIDICPDLFEKFDRWCFDQAVSKSSVIRGWIDHREQIAPYIQPRTDSLGAELEQAQKVLQEVERIYG